MQSSRNNEVSNRNWKEALALGQIKLNILNMIRANILIKKVNTGSDDMLFFVSKIFVR